MMLDSVRIPVFSSRFVESWGKGGDATITDSMEYAHFIPIEQALRTEYRGDAHACAYDLISSEGPEEVCYRLNKDVLRDDTIRAAIRMQVAFVDLDTNPHEPWSSPDVALRTVEALRALFPNCAIFTTRRGARVVFILSRPCGPIEYERAARALVESVQRIIEDAALPLDVDNTTTQWWRMFRMPKVMRDGSPTWTEDYFHLSIPSDWRPVEASVDNPTGATVQPGTSYDPSTGSVDRPEPLELEDEDWQMLIEELAEPMARAGYNGLIGKLRKGIPFYVPGERNTTTYQTVRSFLTVYSTVRGEDPPPIAAYSLFYQSTKATKGNASPEEALDELWDMISRILDARAFVDDPENTRLSLKTTLTVHGRMPILVYTGGRSRYIWDPARNGYTEPIGSPSSLRAGFISLWGQVFDLSIKATDVVFLHAFGTMVDEVILDLGIEVPRIEDNGPRGKALVMPVGRRVKVEPEYDPHCAAWLRELSGEDHEGMLSWLHYVTKHREPLCALYLRGRKSAGKSMIAQALSMFYGGLFVDFDEAVHRFNGRLRNSPLIWLDENSEQSNTAMFRKLVGNSIHKVERKGVDSETLRGQIRLLITANNDDALDLSDVTTVHDVEAITERVRFIAVPDHVGAWLAERGGRTFTEDWIEDPETGKPGRLCRHIAWLAENHEPKEKGSRLRVEGVPTSWHYRALYSGDVGAVIARLAEEVAKNQPTALARYDRERGVVMVNAVAFLASPTVRSSLKQEGVGVQSAREIIRSICLEKTEIEQDGHVWSVVPRSILADMPRVAYRQENAWKAIQSLFFGEGVDA